MDGRLWKHRWRKALLVTSLLRFVPFVQLVGLNGSMATGKMRPESDIDFFIVLRRGHLFSGRFLVLAVVYLLGVKLQDDDRAAGKICLNRFASDDFLDITEHNQYHADVFHNLLPLYARGACYDSFYQVNQWMADFNQPVVWHHPVLQGRGLVRLIQWLAEIPLVLAGPRLEKYLENIQRERIYADQRSRDPRSRVIITNQELRVHFAK